MLRQETIVLSFVINRNISLIIAISKIRALVTDDPCFDRGFPSGNNYLQNRFLLIGVTGTGLVILQKNDFYNFISIS